MKEINMLNAWVANVIMGVEAHDPCNHPGCFNHLSHPCEECGRLQGVDFRAYTTDLNLAFEAAEKAGLFTEEHPAELRRSWRKNKTNGAWVVELLDISRPHQMCSTIGIVWTHENPATAICMAIYKLKTGTDWNEEK